MVVYFYPLGILTQTDSNGEFNLNIDLPPKSVLVFSKEGYQTFSAIEQGKMDLPDGKKGAIIVVPNGVFTAADGKVIVHFKTKN